MDHTVLSPLFTVATKREGRSFGLTALSSLPPLPQPAKLLRHQSLPSPAFAPGILPRFYGKLDSWDQPLTYLFGKKVLCSMYRDRLKGGP